MIRLKNDINIIVSSGSGSIGICEGKHIKEHDIENNITRTERRVLSKGYYISDEDIIRINSTDSFGFRLRHINEIVAVFKLLGVAEGNIVIGFPSSEYVLTVFERIGTDDSLDWVFVLAPYAVPGEVQ